MKKYISAPLCSALIIPGLGQVINRDMIKGLILLGIVFVLVNVVLFRLVFMLIGVWDDASTHELSGEDLLSLIRSSGLPVIRVSVLLFALTWAYAVGDAFKRGLEIESEKRADDR